MLQTAGLLSTYPEVMLMVVWRYKYTAVLLLVQIVLKNKMNINNINLELQIFGAAKEFIFIIKHV